MDTAKGAMKIGGAINRPAAGPNDRSLGTTAVTIHIRNFSLSVLTSSGGLRDPSERSSFFSPCSTFNVRTAIGKTNPTTAIERLSTVIRLVKKVSGTLFT